MQFKSKLLAVIGIVALLLIVFVLFVNPKGEVPIESMPAPEIFNPWKVATHPYDPDCKKSKCTPMGPFGLGHMDEALNFTIQPEVDDAIAQWGSCLDSLMNCVEIGRAIGTCVDQSTCPTDCKQRYHVSASSGQDRLADLQAIEDLFVREGAACRATAEHIR